MTIPQKEDGQKTTLSTCQGCASGNVIIRLQHHIGWIENRGSLNLDLSRLGEHLKKVYGQDYVESDKLKRRLEFVETAWLIFRDELKDGQWQFSMSEAYNLAAIRLHCQRKPVGQAPIDRSQPTGDR